MHAVSGISLQGRSGKVALPRTKLVLADAAVFAALEAPARRAVEASEVRSIAVAMFADSRSGQEIKTQLLAGRLLRYRL